MALGLVLLASLAYAFLKLAPAGGKEVDQARTDLGRSLYATHCARCHAKNMEVSQLADEAAERPASGPAA